MKVYKLTDANDCTRNDTQWGEGVTHTAKSDRLRLCTDGWIHWYTDPVLAILMNPIHTDFYSPHMWEAEASGIVLLEPLKGGSKTLTTIKQIPVPTITVAQRVAFGILCALEVYKNNGFKTWATQWLSGVDRSVDAAAFAAEDAAYAATYAAVYAATYATYAATYADAAATYADAAANAAHAAAYAANAANNAIDFAALAHKALTYS